MILDSATSDVVSLPNVTSVVQPLDQGIIASLKFNTRRNFCGGFRHNMMMLH